ncbi:GxxExxY protein [soil metagenome]
MNKKYLNELTYNIVGAAIEVHKELGPGLLESVYQKCLKKEFTIRNLKFQSELLVEINYKGEKLNTELRCDFLVEDAIIVELKAVEGITPVHEAQLLTYMKLLKKPKGILINFNTDNIFKQGQKTYVNDLFRTLPDE